MQCYSLYEIQLVKIKFCLEKHIMIYDKIQVPNTEAMLPCRTKLQLSLSYILGKHLAKHDLVAALHPVF
jgi:hypothetical protein